MSKPQFTPGPWRHLKQYDHMGDFCRSYVCYGEPDAVNPDDSTFPPDQCICGCGKSHWQQNEANAALIAAAPEMYDILERLETLSEECKAYPLIALGKTIFDIVEEAKKALKKARGEAK